MSKIKLITEQFIKDYSPIMNNVEDQFLSIHILESQDIELRYILGSGLFEEIISEYTAFAEHNYQDINTYVSIPNQKLRDDYIKYILLYYTLYHSIYDLDSKLTNKGIEQQSSNYSTNSYNTQIENRRKDYKNIGETYVSRMLDYMVSNVDDYPTYKDFIKCDDTTRFDSGWYLGTEL